MSQVSSLDDDLSKIIKYGVIIYSFAIWLKHEKQGVRLVRIDESGERKLGEIRLPEDWFKPNANLFPQDSANRYKPEKVVTEMLSDALQALKGTVVNLESKDFDDLLYFLYHRKARTLTLSEAEKLYLLKIKTLEVSVKDLPGMQVRFSIYLLLKKTTTHTPSNSANKSIAFSAVASLCAVIEPISQDFMRLARSLETTEDFPLTQFVGGGGGNATRIHDLMLSTFVKDFLKKMNPQADSKVESTYISKSRSFQTAILCIDFAKFTADPLTLHETTELPNDGALKMFLLNLLFPDFSYTEDHREAFPPNVVLGKIETIKKVLEGPYTVYFSPVSRKVVILDYSHNKKGLEQLNFAPTMRDYNPESPRWSISWDLLMDSLLVAQDMVFAIYDGIIDNEQTNKKQFMAKRMQDIAEALISDFKEFYGIGITRNQGNFILEYRTEQQINGLDKNYDVLINKMDLYIGNAIKWQSQQTLNAQDKSTSALLFATIILAIFSLSQIVYTFGPISYIFVPVILVIAVLGSWVWKRI
jgi:hypothetical protein